MDRMQHPTNTSLNLVGTLAGRDVQLTLTVDEEAKALRVRLASPRTGTAVVEIYTDPHGFGISYGKYYFRQLDEVDSDPFEGIRLIPTYIQELITSEVHQRGFIRHGKVIGWEQVVRTPTGEQHRSYRGDCRGRDCEVDDQRYVPF